MQALSSIGSTLSGGQGWIHGLTNTLNLASGLSQSFAPLFMGQGNPFMGMMSGMPLAMRGLQGMFPQGPTPVNRIDSAYPSPPDVSGLTPPIDWGSIFSSSNYSLPSYTGGPQMTVNQTPGGGF